MVCKCSIPYALFFTHDRYAVCVVFVTPLMACKNAIGLMQSCKVMRHTAVGGHILWKLRLPFFMPQEPNTIRLQDKREFEHVRFTCASIIHFLSVWRHTICNMDISGTFLYHVTADNRHYERLLNTLWHGAFPRQQ